MHINEAVRKAMETNSYIFRKSVGIYTDMKARIMPTNSYETCIITVIQKGEPKGGSRCWNPTADDLMADDWEVINE